MFQGSIQRRCTVAAVALLAAIGAFRLFLTTRYSLIPDECYYWLWSKFPDWSYFSKGPMVAWTIRLGTALCGDTEFGVRWPAVALHVATGWLFFSFARRLFGPRAALWTLLGAMTVPLFAVGGIVMTIDPLSVFFWAAATVVGWEAWRRPGWGNWLLVGALIGLGFLSKFTNAIQGLCIGLFLLLTREGRAILRTPKPWVGGALSLALTAPFWIWNTRNGWVTFGHLAARGALDRPFRVSPSEFWQFLTLQAVVFSPLLWLCVVVAVVWGVGRVARGRGWAGSVVCGRWRDPRVLYLLCQFLPLFGFFAVFALNEAGQPNWTVPGYFTGFILAGGLWHAACRKRPRLRGFAFAALGLSLLMTALLHDTRPLRLRAGDDPLSRVRGWDEAARRVGKAIDETGADFVIANHYALASALTWHLRDRGFGPQRRVYTPHDPTGQVRNQLDLWPGYGDRAGQSAVFVSTGKGTPKELRAQFGSFTNLTKPEWVEENGLPVMRLRLWLFRDFKGLAP
jgi:hypothetical protein